MIAQPFLWIWILEDDRWEFLNDEDYYPIFHVSSFLLVLFLIGSKFEIGFYSNELLILYSAMVWITTNILIFKFHFSFRKAIANSFLIVYLNSYYWESFMHIWAIQENGLNMNQVFQALHLVPAVYFVLRYKFDVQEAIDQFGRGFFVSAIIGFTRAFRLWKYLPMVHSEQTVYFINHGLMIMNRLICWVYLFNIVIVWGMHKNDYRKLMRQTKILYNKEADPSMVV